MSISLYATLEVRLKGYQDEVAQLTALWKHHPWRKRYCLPRIYELNGKIEELKDVLLMIKSVGAQD